MSDEVREELIVSLQSTFGASATRPMLITRIVLFSCFVLRSLIL